MAQGARFRSRGPFAPPVDITYVCIAIFDDFGTFPAANGCGRCTDRASRRQQALMANDVRLEPLPDAAPAANGPVAAEAGLMQLGVLFEQLDQEAGGGYPPPAVPLDRAKENQLVEVRLGLASSRPLQPRSSLVDDQ